MGQWSGLNWVEKSLIIAARRRRTDLTTAITGNPNPTASDACQRFLEAHGPEYEAAREWVVSDAGAHSTTLSDCRCAGGK